ncbi:hypothetical protein [Sphingomonas sp. 37zxx]|uniref:hypothetical protein n=1 Tax=Sphingomonas sp. 37zxx TaxID=1550073 RepID=UPI00053C0109|nr:hypothetical protein [Sphingomonas sp. 37zxx]
MKLLSPAAVATVALSGSAADGAAPSQLPPQLVALAPVVVPIIGLGQIEGALRVKLVLAANDAEGLVRLTERLPALRAATIGSTIEFARLYASARAPVDAVRLRAELTTALKAENKDVADILIVEVSAG